MINRQCFGITAAGEPVYALRITCGRSAVTLLTLGAAIQSLTVPNRSNLPVDVCLGYGSVADYEANDGCMGAVVGRCANRIGGAEISLDGATFRLSENRKGFHIHGGFHGYQSRIWNWSCAERSVTFYLEDLDGTEGYPGTVYAEVTYSMVDERTLSIHYFARCTKKTVINLTNHSYFHPDGHNAGAIGNCSLWVNAETATEADDMGMPTGTLIPVAGSEWDYRMPHRALTRLKTGLDLCYLPEGNGMRPFARVEGATLGLEISADTPALQVYTANFLRERRGKYGSVYFPQCAICLEPSYLPDAIHHPRWKQPVFTPERPYCHTTILHFY